MLRFPHVGRSGYELLLYLKCVKVKLSSPSILNTMIKFVKCRLKSLNMQYIHTLRLTCTSHCLNENVSTGLSMLFSSSPREQRMVLLLITCPGTLMLTCDPSLLACQVCFIIKSNRSCIVFLYLIMLPVMSRSTFILLVE